MEEKHDHDYTLDRVNATADYTTVRDALRNLKSTQEALAYLKDLQLSIRIATTKDAGLPLVLEGVYNDGELFRYESERGHESHLLIWRGLSGFVAKIPRVDKDNRTLHERESTIRRRTLFDNPRYNAGTNDRTTTPDTTTPPIDQLLSETKTRKRK